MPTGPDEIWASGVGAELIAPSAPKQEQGWITTEKPGAGHMNWKFNQYDQWIDFLANGGATVTRATLAAWKAVTRTGAGFELVRGVGLVYFDPSATDYPDDVNVFQQTSGTGRGFLELAHPDYLSGQLMDIFGTADLTDLYSLLNP